MSTLLARYPEPPAAVQDRALKDLTSLLAFARDVLIPNIQEGENAASEAAKLNSYLAALENASPEVAKLTAVRIYEEVRKARPTPTDD